MPASYNPGILLLQGSQLLMHPASLVLHVAAPLATPPTLAIELHEYWGMGENEMQAGNITSNASACRGSHGRLGDVPLRIAKVSTGRKTLQGKGTLKAKNPVSNFSNSWKRVEGFESKNSNFEISNL